MQPLGTLLEGVAPQSQQQELLDIDGTLFIQLGLFVALAFTLNKLLWRPYLRLRTERVARVEGYRAEAARLEADAAARLGKVDAELGEVKRMGAGERAVARAEAHAREQTILAGATAEAQRTLAEARVKVEAALETERAKLEETAQALGREASRRILGREVQP